MVPQNRDDTTDVYEPFIHCIVSKKYYRVSVFDIYFLNDVLLLAKSRMRASHNVLYIDTSLPANDMTIHECKMTDRTPFQ